MILNSLYSEPETFDPVKFYPGINIITGEKSGQTESGNKTNGVGKTLLFNFIDFCLLSDYSKNRIKTVPKEIIKPTTKIVLEFTHKEKKFVVKRSRQDEGTPQIQVNGSFINFNSIDDARKFLFTEIFNDRFNLTFRNMLRIFKRTENSGYLEIDKPDGSRIQNIAPYLVLFGFDIDDYQKLLTEANDLKNYHDNFKQIKKEIESTGISVREASAQSNELKAQLEVLDLALEELSHSETYEVISEDVAELDFELENASLQLASIREEIKQIENIPTYQEISLSEIKSVYNDCKQSLGDLIVKELDEIQEFKNAIDNFKNRIIQERKNKLLSRQRHILQDIKKLSEKYQQKTDILQVTGELKSLKKVVIEHQSKQQEYNQISFLYNQYEQCIQKKENAKKRRDDALELIRRKKEQLKENVDDFEKMILKLHRHIYGNQFTSFRIAISDKLNANSKSFIKFEFETEDAGSSRSEHEKTLMFDLSLLFCASTRKNHLELILHDGAFEGVNENTKFQILNWLYEQQQTDKNFQYIISINRDSFEHLETNQDFTFQLNNFVRAAYTKDNRFLKRKY